MRLLTLIALAFLTGCQDHGYTAGQVAPLNAPEMSMHDAVAALTLTAVIVCMIADRKRE